VIPIPIVKLILVTRILVESMLSVKVQVVEPFVNVPEGLLETLLFDVMIILVIKILVEPMLTVKMLEIEQFADAGMGMKVIRLYNVP